MICTRGYVEKQSEEIVSTLNLVEILRCNVDSGQAGAGRLGGLAPIGRRLLPSSQGFCNICCYIIILRSGCTHLAERVKLFERTSQRNRYQLGTSECECKLLTNTSLSSI